MQDRSAKSHFMWRMKTVARDIKSAAAVSQNKLNYLHPLNSSPNLYPEHHTRVHFECIHTNMDNCSDFTTPLKMLWDVTLGKAGCACGVLSIPASHMAAFLSFAVHAVNPATVQHNTWKCSLWSSPCVVLSVLYGTLVCEGASQVYTMITDHGLATLWPFHTLAVSLYHKILLFMLHVYSCHSSFTSTRHTGQVPLFWNDMATLKCSFV